MKRRIFINDKQIYTFIHLLGLYDYLQKYKYVLEIPLDVTKMSPTNPYPDKIWICWFQGIENAPDIVKACVRTILEHSDGQDVIILDTNNIFNYVNIPDYLVEKWQKGVISNTHFSDILRMTLLTEYGGVWIDSTSYMTNKMPEYIRSAEIFCFKAGPMGKIVASNWFFVSKPYNEIIWKTKNLLYEYWKKENKLVAYSMFHPFFTMATESNLACQEMWRKVPDINDCNSKILYFKLFNPFNLEEFKLISQTSFIQKLSYKFDNKVLEKSGTFFDIIKNGISL